MIREHWIQQKNAPFSLRARLRSFIYAWNGIVQFFMKEHNAQLHLISTLVVTGLAFYFKTTVTESILLVFAVGFVWVTEMINSSIEKIMDFITVEKHDQVKQIKDIAAGAVLVASITALITGVFIFIPKFFM